MRKQLSFFLVLTSVSNFSNQLNSAISDSNKEQEEPRVLESKAKVKPKQILKPVKIIKKQHISKLPRKQVVRLSSRRRVVVNSKFENDLGAGPSGPSGSLSDKDQNKNIDESIWNEENISDQENQNNTQESVIAAKEKSYETLVEEIFETKKQNSNTNKNTDLKLKNENFSEVIQSQKEKYETALAKLKMMQLKVDYKLVQEKYKIKEYDFYGVSKSLAFAITNLVEKQLEYKQAKQKLDAWGRKGQVDIIEKVNESLKMIITTETWAKIVTLVKAPLFSTEDFLDKLKYILSFFHKVEFYQLRDTITVDDISSLAHLINNYFSDFHYLFKEHVADGQALKIISYTGYNDGYWQRNDDSYYEIVGEKSYHNVLANVKFLAEKKLQEAEQKIIESAAQIIEQEKKLKEFSTEKLEQELDKILMEHAKSHDEVFEARAKIAELEISSLVSELIKKYENIELQLSEHRSYLIAELSRYLISTMDYFWKLTYKNDNNALNLLKDIIKEFNEAQKSFQESTDEWNKAAENLDKKDQKWRKEWEILFSKKLTYECQKKEYNRKLTAQSNFVEKYYKLVSSELKITITKETWTKIKNLLFSSPTKNKFLDSLNKEIDSFTKIDYSGWFGSITDADIKSLGNLIFNNFLFYESIFTKLHLNNALKIISYSGYKEGYFDSYLNEVINQKILTKEEKSEFIINHFYNIKPSEEEFVKAREEYNKTEEEYIIKEESYYVEEEKFLSKLLDLEIRLIQSQEQDELIKEADKEYSELTEEVHKWNEWLKIKQ